MTELMDRLAGLSPEKRRLLEMRMKARAAQAQAAAPELGAREQARAEFPLSFAQQRLWLVDRLTPGTGTYNIPFPQHMRGELHHAALERAFNTLVERHESLRTTFEERAGEPVQVVHPHAPIPLEIEDLSHLPPDELRAEVDRRRRVDANAPFDLEHGPVLRARLLKLADDDHLLLACMHHIVGDGWSLAVFTRELAELYAAFREGRDPELKPLPIQYADYAAWQRRWLSGDTLEQHLAFWRRYLGGAPPALELPTDRPRPAAPSFRGESKAILIPAEVGARLRALALEEGTTLFAVLLAAVRAVLGRWSGEDDVVVGTPVAGRTRSEVEGLVGVFINTLALRTPLGGNPTFRQQVRREKESLIDAFSHQELPFERVVEELKLPRDLSRHPLFQVMLALQNVGGGPLELEGVDVRSAGGAMETAKFDITMDMREWDNGAIVAGARWALDLFDASTMERLLGHVHHLLDAASSAPDVPLSAIPLEDVEALDQAHAEWNDTSADVPPACLHRLFEARAAADPAAPAVISGEATVTYGELDARANRLAHRLRALGVGPDVLVGLCIDRGIDSIVALLAVQKAGGAYVALDPTAPAERRALLLADAGAKVLVAEAEFAVGVPSSVAVVRVDAEREAIARESAEPVDSGVSPRNLAYVIYTSGSTGKPKGVLVEHRNASNFVAHQIGYYGITPGDRLLHVAPLFFDASIAEVFTALCGGATLVVASRDQVIPGPELAALIRRARVTSARFTPSALGLLPDGALPDLRAVTVGGESCPADLVARWATTTRRLVNVYGPTETTVRATMADLKADGRRPPLGGPIANVRLYVLDEGMRPLPIGLPGELYIAGAGVTRGYLGRPGMTAEKYLPEPFSGGSGERMYRTGDKVRRLPNGELEFLGRVDEQVKVRGFRIEPGEVEAALREAAGVDEAAVVARTNGGGDAKLVAYVSARDGSLSPAELREALLARLPEYMVPSLFVTLPAFPRTAGGKIDRRALPDPEPETGEEYAPPETETEKTLAGLWESLLGAQRVGLDDDFFLLGGHSLLATQLVSRIRERFAVELPLRALFEASTVRGLAPRVDALVSDAKGDGAPPLVPVMRDGPLPLSFAQERLWFLAQLDPGTQVYNVPVHLELEGALDLGALERAMTELQRRHEPLRTLFEQGDAGPVQVILPPFEIRLDVEDLTRLPEDERVGEATRIAGEEGRRPFDLRTDVSWRARLLKLADDRHLLAMSIHHIATDGWSTQRLLGELRALYDAFSRGLPSPLPPLAVQYADFAVWQREWLRGERMEAQLAYWRGRLVGAPAVLELPTDRPRPAVQDLSGRSFGFRLPPAASRGAKELAQREGATLYMVLLAAFTEVLRRWSGQDDVVVGTPVAGRTRRELEPLVGFFANTLALRTDLSGDPSYRELLARVRETTLDAYAHQDVPFEKLVEELNVERSLSHTPLFQVMFTLQNAPGAPSEEVPEEAAASAPSASPLGMQRLGSALGTSRFDLTIGAGEWEGEVVGGVEYASALFDEPTVRRLIAHLGALLEAAAAEPGAPLSSLSILAPGERAALVAAASPTEERPVEQPLHAIFAARAAGAPDAVALTLDGRSLTYGELDRESNRLAHHLRRHGVGAESRVGLCVERSIETIVGILGILKAGGAYVPLDPAYPADRLAYMLADSGARVVVTDGAAEGRLPLSPSVHFVHLADDGEAISGESDSAPGVEVGADHLAYVIYTSGSTGRPKGCMVTHGNVVRLMTATEHWFGFGPGDTFALFHSYAFDVSVWEMWGALLYGGRLVIVPFWVSREAEAFYALLEREKVTVLDQTPSAFRPLMRADEEAAAEGKTRTLALRAVIFAGEALEPASLRGWVERRGIDTPALVNMYGITETTVHVTWRVMTEVDVFGGAASPVGVQIPDLSLHVLDARGEPSPVGVPGEIFVGGPGVARGYLDRPALTAQRFVPDPFSTVPGGRLYRSGDLARRLQNGELDYLGRADDQVKVRGFRIELGEVEAAAASHPSVAQAVVVAKGEGADRRLVAYVVPRPDETVSAAVLRAHLSAMLPEYMVPAQWVAMEALPLTPSGKVARRALPEPVMETAVGEQHVPPRTPAEEVVAGIWEKVLGTRPGVHDNFFDLGGHSLKATQVVARIRAAFGIDLPLRALFEEPSVAGLAERAQAARRHAGSPLPPLVPMRRDRPIPLSFAQQRFWFVETLGAARSAYHLPYVLRFDGSLDAAALEGALNDLVERHESLRTTFGLHEGQPVQVIAPRLAIPLPVEDLSALAEGERDAEVARLTALEAGERFDLAKGPVLRARLVRLSPDANLFLLTLHHVVGDAWSMRVLFRELAELYAARIELRAPHLSPLPVQYADYAIWQRERLDGPGLERELAFWRERLAGTATLALPTDRPRPPVPSFRGANHAFALPAELAERVRELAREAGATPFMALLAAFSALLYRWSGTEDVVVGSATAGRVPEETEGLIGVFVNTLVHRTDVSGDPTFRELLARVREGTLDAYAHEDAPFERLVDDLKIERSLSRHPVFQVVFAMHAAEAPKEGEGDGDGGLPGVRMSGAEGTTGTAKVDLNLTLVDRPDGIAGAFQYAVDLFDASTVERMAGHFRRLLEAAVADPATRVSDLPLAGEEELARIDAWGRNEHGHPLDTPIHRMVEERVARHPHALAVATEAERWSFAELNARANRLARRLRALGVGGEKRVALLMDRSTWLVAGELAVLKAGGAYVPLDPAAPAERIAYMLADSGACALLTVGAYRGSVPATSLPVVVVDGGDPALETGSDADLDVAVDPECVAYVIYTSGSTGRPKGVEVRHRGMANLVGFYRSGLGVREGDRLSLLTSPSFDASAGDTWGGLCNGVSLHVGPERLLSDPRGLMRWLDSERLNFAFLPTPAAEAAVEAAQRGEPWHERLSIGAGGEALRVRPLPGRTLINCYGPTENTVFSTFCEVEPQGEGLPAIGGPVDNYRLRVLDARLRPVPVGVAGELYVAGEGLARGYLNRPALTAERFIPDPFPERPGERMYRTGDVVKWRGDGQLDYLGRVDRQLKLRGFRIEPGEIESALLQHPAVAQAAVMVRGEGNGRRLVAYVEPAAGTAPFAGTELREFLKDRLPDFMLPTAYVVMDALPMTVSGKVDRMLLPDPAEAGGPGREAAPPRNATERAIAKVWEEVIGVERVGVDDNFFEIGGHSLLLARMQERLREALGKEVSVIDLFQYATVGALAAHLDPRGDEPREDAAPKQGQDRADRRREMMRRTRK